MSSGKCNKCSTPKLPRLIPRRFLLKVYNKEAMKTVIQFNYIFPYQHSLVLLRWELAQEELSWQQRVFISFKDCEIFPSAKFEDAESEIRSKLCTFGPIFMQGFSYFVSPLPTLAALKRSCCVEKKRNTRKYILHNVVSKNKEQSKNVLIPSKQ